MGTAISDIAKQTSESETGAKTEGPATETTRTSVSGSPISNETYDVIAALHAKLEALDAYRKYSADADPELWEELRQGELPAICRLVDKLESIFKEGKVWASPEGHH